MRELPGYSESGKNPTMPNKTNALRRQKAALVPRSAFRRR